MAYTNGKPKQEKEWYSDGSKLNQGEDSEVHRAATAMLCGELEEITRVQGPQTSYRAELQGARLFVELAADGDTLALDNKAVVDYGPYALTGRRQIWTTACRRLTSCNRREQA